MAKMIDLKLTKADKKVREKKYTIEDQSEQYPYGLQVNFDEEMVEKVPHLQGVNGGDEVLMLCHCKVKSVNISDDDKPGKPRRRVEVQIRAVDIKPAGDKTDFAGAFAEEDEE